MMMLPRVACTRVTGRVAQEKDVKDIFTLPVSLGSKQFASTVWDVGSY